MSNINKQSLREQFEAWWEVNYHNGNPPRFGWEYWRDGDGYKIDDDESELDGMWESWQAAHSSKLEAAEKRIAELEAREVQLPPKAPDNLASCLDGYEKWLIATTFRDTWNACLAEVVHVNAAAGKGE
jgi:hypothetical protein